MSRGFRGDVADYYQRYRRGYPPEVFDTLTTVFTLTTTDTAIAIAIDLGCGTGQLTIPLTDHTGAVIGMDIEPDMLAHARAAAGERPITWLLGGDTHLPHLIPLLGPQSVSLITIGQALHWMDHDTLFRTAHPLLRTGGGVAVITNGTPLWLQDTTWSRALRTFMENWLGRPLAATCGTDPATQQRYRDSLTTAGYTVHTHEITYTTALDIDQIVGGVYSALSPEQLPTDRDTFHHDIHRALSPHQPYTEHVTVTMLLGIRSD
ncbi:class I SAM-dependent methyltransferase [Kibdelosporangium persicum]|uniref:Class I SAM-dependent methyltransferase n=1 Tax=Kibdelosporangium persicum TaxID=2698649 RepID=A0ABX2F2G9_9PSEU|nr:class I SAM-dependent methyltransferase [Kibdelosporangium persicum]NRN65418.1 Class I SAM-dependent methyltransferase [Kibdelosporangium persicum]